MRWLILVVLMVVVAACDGTGALDTVRADIRADIRAAAEACRDGVRRVAPGNKSSGLSSSNRPSPPPSP